MLIMLGLKSSPKASAAACATPATDYGSVTQTVNITSGGSYRLWSRMKAAATDANANSYLMEIDGNTCFTVGDDAGITSGAWKWVDYQNGTTSSKIDQTLTAGNHTIKMIGREAGVQLDRLLFLSPMDSCITNTSTGNGDSCTTPPAPANVPPTVSVTAPANNATYTAPASITINATAADSDGTVSKVEFFQGTTKLGEDLANPYTYSWSSVAAGTYAITAKATDNANAVTTSTAVNVTVTSPTAGQADLIVTAVMATPANPTPGQAVTFSATIKNQGTAATPAGIIHGVLFSVDSTPVSYSDNDTSSLAAGATRTLTANSGPSGVATWAATAGSHTVLATVDDVNRIIESNESNNTGTLSLTVSTLTYRAEDINQDRSVDFQDFFIFRADFNKCGTAITNPRSDITNSDGLNCVNFADFFALRAVFGLTY